VTPPADPSDDPPANDSDDPDDTPVHAVTLVRVADGSEATVPVRADRTVVDGAEAADEPLPYGCLTGACGTCTGQVIEGDLHHRRPPRALKDRHLADGYALLCIAEPRSDCRLRVGSDVQGELVANPWK